MTGFGIFCKIAFVYFTCIINQNALAMLLLFADSPKINLIGILGKPDFIKLLLNYLLHIDMAIREGAIFHKEITELFLIFSEDPPNAILLLANLEPKNFVIEN